LRRSKLKTGVLGGTFDPIHNAHIIVAEEAIFSLDLAEVLFIPTAQTPLKEDLPMSAAEHRVQMVRLSIAGYPHFKLSTVEIDRPGISYTVDTISELRDNLGAEDELFFIVGWDSLAQLHRWKEPARMVQMCHLVAVPRPGYSLPDLDSLEKDVPGLSQKLIVLDKPEIDISSTSIRERVARGLSIDHLVPPPVADYIKQNRLYLS
jgi:nicotinate-nucleotide adenylyltransferase